MSADPGKLVPHVELVAIAGKAHTYHRALRPYRRNRTPISDIRWIDKHPVAVRTGRGMQAGPRALGKPGPPERAVVAGMPGKGVARRASGGAR